MYMAYHTLDHFYRSVSFAQYVSDQLKKLINFICWYLCLMFCDIDDYTELKLSGGGNYLFPGDR